MPEPLTNKEEIKQVLMKSLNIEVFDGKDNSERKIILTFDGVIIDKAIIHLNTGDT